MQLNGVITLEKLLPCSYENFVKTRSCYSNSSSLVKLSWKSRHFSTSCKSTHYWPSICSCQTLNWKRKCVCCSSCVMDIAIRLDNNKVRGWGYHLTCLLLNVEHSCRNESHNFQSVRLSQQKTSTTNLFNFLGLSINFEYSTHSHGVKKKSEKQMGMKYTDCSIFNTNKNNLLFRSDQALNIIYSMFPVNYKNSTLHDTRTTSVNHLLTKNQVYKMLNARIYFLLA